MTQSTTLSTNTGSRPKRPSLRQTLAEALKLHLENEKVSFHTPGHKGRLKMASVAEACLMSADLTELDGLDQLSQPCGILLDLEKHIAEIFQACETYISVNGASAALAACVFACAQFGKKILFPVDVHRSAINAAILSGLQPVFYGAQELPEWKVRAGASVQEIAACITEENIAAVFVCSPSYAGITSPIREISELCRQKNVLLIVDEAHGAHFALSQSFPSSALLDGADLVVHSLHKTLCAPTQTGLLHVGKDSRIQNGVMRSFLNALQSSSPSYLLMLGIESALDAENISELKCSEIIEFSKRITDFLSEPNDYELLDSVCDPLHIVFKHKNLSAEQLRQYLQSQGIFPETILGEAVLLLLGFGSSADDVEYLLNCLSKLETSSTPAPPYTVPLATKIMRDPESQLMDLRKAFFSASKMTECSSAQGELSADCVAPCPPGWAVLLPGQLIDSTTLRNFSPTHKLRVVNKSNFQGESNGPNTPS